MKRSFLYLSLLCMFMLTLSTPAFAATKVQNNSLKDLKLNFQTMKGHKGRTQGQLIKELLDDGLSATDAEFYADLDILVNQVEENHIEVDLGAVSELSPQYAKINPDIVRQQALNLDPSALKTILAQNDSMSFGHKDAKAAINTLNKKAHGYHITIQYPDGSKFIEGSDTTKIDPESNQVKPNTYYPGPWNKSTKFNTDYSILNEGRYLTKSYWSYVNGSSVAKVEDAFTWDFNKPSSGWYTNYVSDTGSSSYAGVVSISTEYLSNHQNSSTLSYTYIQGYTDVRFTVSGSFSASYAGMGISVAAGAGWHEYAVTEIDGVADVYSWAAQFL